MRDFKQLLLWQKAHQLTLELYKVTKHFPDEERFGLKSQIRRCAGSVGANIAEGCGRRGNGQLATGSVSELDIICYSAAILDTCITLIIADLKSPL